MAPEDDSVKGRIKRFREFVDTHPRTGWYIAFMVTLNFLVELCGLFK